MQSYRFDYGGSNSKGRTPQTEFFIDPASTLDPDNEHYAEQISRDASKITEADIARLRDVGLSDLNIADIALAAAFRSFMSRYFDAVGANVEDDFLDDDPAVRDEMAVGRKPSH